MMQEGKYQDAAFKPLWTNELSIEETSVCEYGAL
jgi:hypothetical protein